MSIPQALRTLGLLPGDDRNKIKNRYRELARKFHPDLHPGDAIAEESFKQISNAYETLENANLETKIRHRPSERRPSEGDPWGIRRDQRFYQEYDQPRHTTAPEWETDKRSIYHEVGDSFRNLNYCKKTIYEEAKKQGEVEEYTLWAWDGMYFRGVFSVYANPSVFGLAGEAMQTWNESGCPYNTAVVFIAKKGSRILHLIRHNGVDVSDQGITYEHESVNMSPSNDQSFVRFLRKEYPLDQKN